MPGPPKPAEHMATDPPNRARLDTELDNPRSRALHQLDVGACVELLQTEDQAAFDAAVQARAALVAFIQAVASRFGPCDSPSPGRLIYIGAGTSGRLGVLDASEAPPTFCVPPGLIVGIIAGGEGALRRSSEGREDEPDGARTDLEALALTSRDTVLGIAAGGTTPYVLGGLQLAKALAPGCLTGLLTCARVPKPPACDHLILLATGPEVLTGSTRLKAGTATKLALNTISTTLMVQSGRVYGNLMVDVRATNDKLRDRAARVVSTLTGLDRAAALALLDRADGHAKVAVVMARLTIDAATARAKLAEVGVGGRLSAVIDQHPAA